MMTRNVSLQSGSVLHIYCAPFATNLATTVVLLTTAPFCEIIIIFLMQRKRENIFVTLH